MLYTLSNDGPINAYKISRATGELTAITGDFFLGGTNLAAGFVDLTGRYPYTANGDAENVLAYRMSPSEELHRFPAALSPTSGGNEWIAVDPTDRFVFVTNSYGANKMDAFSITSSIGDLVTVPGSRYATAMQPNAVVCNASGQFVYVAEGTGSTGGIVTAFSVNLKTGSLTPIAGATYPVGGSQSGSSR
ncbi:MAG: beta-propeller fold lactonase family protein [Bryobacteraceae bacterium]